jgi:type II secretory pathway pseudopilin PulG
VKKIRKKFSVVEIIIVVAISAVLLGLLISALSSARTKARRTLTINNLKQISIALNQYEDLHGCFPVISEIKTGTQCLFLLIPYLNNLATYYTPEEFASKQGDASFNTYVNNPTQLYNDVRSGSTSLIPGFAYSGITNEGYFVYCDTVSPETPVVCTLNGAYPDAAYILNYDSSITTVYGDAATQTIIE